MKRLKPSQFTAVSDKVVKYRFQAAGWRVYEHYEIREEDEKTFVVAPVSEPRIGSAERDTRAVYAPLRTPGPVLDLAELAEEEITPEIVRDWAEYYGLLGFPDDDVERRDDEFGRFESKGQGRRDSVRRFAEAAGEVRVCLRIYEAIRADEDVDLKELSDAYAHLLPSEAIEPESLSELRAGEDRSRLAHVIGRLVQMRLEEFCYPRFGPHTRGGVATGRFVLAWGYRGLIGAIWLQMAWLLEEAGESARTCELPGCLRVIHFESGRSADELGSIKDADGRFKTNARGKYKTRDDIKFCKGRGHKQKYHYRKKAGWPGYF